MTWTAYADPPEVMPDDDLKSHYFGEQCWCRPFLDDGIIVHNSLDGREGFERGEREPS